MTIHGMRCCLFANELSRPKKQSKLVGATPVRTVLKRLERHSSAQS